MLRDKKFHHIYSSSETESTPYDFFSDALSNSTSFDLGLGFFSTASINVLSVGFANFIVNGGKMRLYINQFLSEEDYKIIASSPKDIDTKILNDFYSLRKTLSKRDEHFFDCLSYLIANKRVDIRIVIPKSGGIAHQKFGIFSDINGNKISFNGSLNFTASALLSKNIESITCSTSWEGGLPLINECEALFSKFFYGLSEDVVVYTPINFEKEVLRTFPPKEIEELLKKEQEIIKTIKLNHKTLTNLETNENEPQFPYPSGPFDYQVEAYKNWIKNNNSGIFAMATGTGKTITSLNCVLQEYYKNETYKVLILVPTIDLVNQWHTEVTSFNYKNIYIVNSKTNWKKELRTLKEDIDWGIHRDFIIISTYASFVDKTFINLINNVADNNTIVIADEAHNIGANTVKKAFSELKIKKRIALSATPNRAFDEEGTKDIELLFEDNSPYCYSFSMEQAIKANRLMKYLYYPRIVYLNAEEMEKYQKYSRMLLRYYDYKNQTITNNSEATKLLMLRKQILHKAHDKYRVFEAIIDELALKNLTKYCFVYSPEGYDPNDDQRIIENLQQIVNKKYPDITTNSLIGGDNRRKDKIRAFEEGHINMLFAMKCLDEGVDVPRTEVGIFTSSTGNPRQFIQRRGRLLRKHKDKQYATIYDLIVVPDFNYSRDKTTYEMERSLVKGELTRVAYFASLASNYNEITSQLSDIADYYELELSILINNLK